MKANPTLISRGLYNRHKAVSLDVARAVEMYLEGFTPAEIAPVLLLIKCSSRVRKGLREAGVWQTPMFKEAHLAARRAMKKAEAIAPAPGNLTGFIASTIYSLDCKLTVLLVSLQFFPTRHRVFFAVESFW